MELGAVDNFGYKCGFSQKRGKIDWARQRSRTSSALERFGFPIDVDIPVGSLSPVARTIIAIAAAIQQWDENGGLLVLDEPTAAFSGHEVKILFDIIREAQRGGASILYVSHRIDEIFSLADRITALRTGEVVGTYPIANLTQRELATFMTGAEVSTDVRMSVTGSIDGPPVLKARNLQGKFLRGVALEVRPGEVVGIAGLLGSGREELPYVLSGSGTDATGDILLGSDGEWKKIKPNGHRLPLVPADRVREGIIGKMTIAENLTLASHRVVSRFGVFRKKLEQRRTLQSLEQVGVVPRDPAIAMETLSGGNQQKVVMMRWIMAAVPILLLSEPTAGVDISARMELYKILIDQAISGVAIVVGSSDTDDLTHLCTRVLVMRNGVISRELSYEEITEENLIHGMEGTDDAA